jgi:hypothetical protein
VATEQFEARITLDGAPVTVRVARDASGELHLGSPDDTSVVEELLVYDIGEDAGDVRQLAQLLRAISAGDEAPTTRAWNVTRLDAGPGTSQLRLQLDGADAPAQVATRDLHDLLVRFAGFLGA